MNTIETKIRQCVLAPNKINKEKPFMLREVIELPKPEPIDRVILANARNQSTHSFEFNIEASFGYGQVIVGQPIESLTEEQESKLESVIFDYYSTAPFKFGDDGFENVPILVANSDKTLQAIRPTE